MDETSSWTAAEPFIRDQVAKGRLDEVEPSAAHAERLTAQARTHLRSAQAVLDSDPAGAFTMLYDAARKAMVAVLAQQGLRATVRGGHRAVQDALTAQLGREGRTMGRRFRELRLRRHDVEYPAVESEPVTTDQARTALESATTIVALLERILPDVTSRDPSV